MMPFRLEPVQTLTIATLLADWRLKRGMDGKVAELDEDATGRYRACSELLGVDFDRHPDGPPAGRQPAWITDADAADWSARDTGSRRPNPAGSPAPQRCISACTPWRAASKRSTAALSPSPWRAVRRRRWRCSTLGIVTCASRYATT